MIIDIFSQSTSFRLKELTIKAINLAFLSVGWQQSRNTFLKWETLQDLAWEVSDNGRAF